MQELALSSCDMPDGLDGPATLPRLQVLEMSWTQRPECNKLLRAAGPTLTRLNLRVCTLAVQHQLDLHCHQAAPLACVFPSGSGVYMVKRSSWHQSVPTLYISLHSCTAAMSRLVSVLSQYMPCRRDVSG